MLRKFCAAAAVPQTEDVGFDAVATLLRRDGRFFYAEDTFCVQFKARSVREIVLERHEYDWFHALAMPLFVASVDLESQEIELYTTHWLAGHLNAKDFTSAVMYLDPGKNSLEGDCMRMGLGSPILRWTAQEAENAAFQTLAYNVLKQWNTIEYVNLGLRRIRSKGMVWNWKTNEAPGEAYLAASSGPDELVGDLEAAMPYLMKIAVHLMYGHDSNEGASMATVGFYLLSNWLREHNVPDAKALVQMMGNRMGLHDDDFRLHLKIEGTTAVPSEQVDAADESDSAARE